MEYPSLLRPLQMEPSNYVSEYGPIKRMPRLKCTYGTSPWSTKQQQL